MRGRPPDDRTTPVPQITSREPILVLQNYRVIAYRYDTAPNEYIVEYVKQDALGDPSWQLLKRITDDNYGLTTEDAFLYDLFVDIHEGVT